MRKIILFVVLCAIFVFNCTSYFFANKNLNEEFCDTSKFEGEKIAVQTGTVYVDKIFELIKDPEVSYYENIQDAVIAIKSNKIHAVISDEPNLAYIVSQVGGFAIEKIKSNEDKIAIISAKNENGNKYIKEFNSYLKKIRENGFYDKLREKHYYNRFDNVPDINYDELPNVNGIVTIASYPAYPPFEYMKNGRMYGFEMELMADFCKEYGYKPNFLNVDFNSIIVGVNSGKYDLGCSGFSITEERKKNVLFSDPFEYCYPAIAYIDNSAISNLGFFESLKNQFNQTFIVENRWIEFCKGAIVTLEITIISILFGTLLGLIIHLLCRGGNALANKITAFCEWLITGLPLVLFLMILFYIVFKYININNILVAIIGFSIIFAISVHTMLVNGEMAIEKGQYLAAKALGYEDNDAFFKIIFPQVIHYIMPTYLSEITSHIRATAIVGYIAVVDLTKVGDLIRGRTYDAFFSLAVVAIMYFVLADLLKFIAKNILRKFDYKKRTEANILKGAIIK